MFSHSNALLSLTFILSILTAAPGVTSASCSISDLKVTGDSLPAQESPTLFLTFGVGTQNYTCSDAGNYTAAGAVAQIFDISCDFKDNVKNLPQFSTDVFKAWSDHHETGHVQTLKGGSIRLAFHSSLFGAEGTVISTLKKDFPSLAKSESLLGEHFFIPNPTGSPGTSPKWDFTKSQKNSKAFVTVQRKASIAAPTGKQDIDWLDLTSIDGELAYEVYRTDTRGGQPPAKCEPGSGPISVAYTSAYWFTQPKSQ
ncbi:hypothetical protein PQX77_008362 [Marasmius sp. AFHP31]|nr:hypothetical protein PQX77_008362 [Marasmius sp. AFHP31]